MKPKHQDAIIDAVIGCATLAVKLLIISLIVVVMISVYRPRVGCDAHSTGDVCWLIVG